MIFAPALAPEVGRWFKAALLLTCTLGAGIVSQPQPLELDHISIVVPPGAALDAAALEAAGFRFLQPTPTVHRDQGTASRSVGFENVYIELIWVTDRAELLAADPELGLRLQHADPRMVRVGLALRRHAAGDSIPFPTREYAAQWTRPLTLHVAKTENTEPYVSIMPPELSWPTAAAGLTAELQHPNGARRVTQVTWVQRKRGAGTPAMAYLRDAHLVRIGFAADYFLEIELDDNRLGKRVDLRPQLPLVFLH